LVAERLSLFAAPSAEKAYYYGNVHMGDGGARLYNLSVARFFYLEALRLDSNHPHAYHQIARISFLKGNLPTALAQIDKQIELHGTTTVNSFYIRGLIKGFMGDYEGSAHDYEVYLRSDPTNWAAINDYAWVLLKAGRVRDALISIDYGLIAFPRNPWLLNSKSVALFELNRYADAHISALAALRNLSDVSEKEWVQAYPGNDPLIAPQGVLAFHEAVRHNVFKIAQALRTPEHHSL